MKNGKPSFVASSMRSPLPVSLIVWWLGCLLICLGEDSTKTSWWDGQDRQFTDSAPYASATEITRHFGYAVPLPDYDLKVEKFRLIVPEGYSTNAAWGVLVWISPGNEAAVPKDLTAELALHHLLMVSAYKSGNDRPSLGPVPARAGRDVQHMPKPGRVCVGSCPGSKGGHNPILKTRR
jgi:hypothetical protein